jgi:uncharacterized membrane protein
VLYYYGIFFCWFFFGLVVVVVVVVAVAVSLYGQRGSASINETKTKEDIFRETKGPYLAA